MSPHDIATWYDRPWHPLMTPTWYAFTKQKFPSTSHMANIKYCHTGICNDKPHNDIQRRGGDVESMESLRRMDCERGVSPMSHEAFTNKHISPFPLYIGVSPAPPLSITIAISISICLSVCACHSNSQINHTTRNTWPTPRPIRLPLWFPSPCVLWCVLWWCCFRVLSRVVCFLMSTFPLSPCWY